MKKILAILIIGTLILSGPAAFAVNVTTTNKTTENIKNNYTNNNIITKSSAFDLVIIAPSEFSKELQRLVKHKNETGIKTILKPTQEIYEEYEGTDPPEEIKFFIRDAEKNWNISYVLLVGGLKSRIRATPRENTNYGAKDWYVPVRYTNMFDNPKYPLLSVNSEGSQDPGVISDLYYADLYYENGSFCSWDPNNDGYFAAFNYPDKNVSDDLGIDLSPDVALGRLACRNKIELRTVIDKIITYELNTYGQEWFNRTMVFSGDGFLDQKDLDIQWDTTGLSNGEYTIYAQSLNKTMVAGGIDSVKVTIDRNAVSKITHNHDDQLQIDTYPGRAVAEITSPSNGDILGKTDVHYAPEEAKYKNAYCNEFSGWANVTYQNGTMYIRGKSYDPSPYGVVTHVHVWVTNENETVVFDQWKYDTEMYFEGEWITGNRLLNGRGGALYYMPDTFEKDVYWASNGRLKDPSDIIKALRNGCGFAFFSGHGSPNVWADHLPGIPGDRANGSFDGLYVVGLRPWRPIVTLPVSPMNKIRNGEKLPVVVIGGCHNSMFNVSLMPSIMSYPLLFLLGSDNKMWTYGAPVSECFSWKLVRIKNGGAIATIGNTGLGYGRIGEEATSGGGDGWISIEFFKQYGEQGHTILGDAFSETVKSYVNTYREDMDVLEEGHAKTVQQWVLLGDPSLRLGGWNPE